MDAALPVGAESAWGIPIGVEVYDVDGEFIGKVSSADTVNLIVTSGWLLLTDYEISLALVGRYDDGKLILTCTKADVGAE
jgi:hypothetical protein